ncbi:Protein of unknown function [Gryllus bimaculatus]|nr:Protein of unknown function [Gryllus bimaculatus]
MHAIHLFNMHPAMEKILAFMKTVMKEKICVCVCMCARACVCVFPHPHDGGVAAPPRAAGDAAARAGRRGGPRPGARLRAVGGGAGPGGGGRGAAAAAAAGRQAARRGAALRLRGLLPATRHRLRRGCAGRGTSVGACCVFDDCALAERMRPMRSP